MIVICFRDSIRINLGAVTADGAPILPARLNLAGTPVLKLNFSEISSMNTYLQIAQPKIQLDQLFLQDRNHLPKRRLPNIRQTRLRLELTCDCVKPGDRQRGPRCRWPCSMTCLVSIPQLPDCRYPSAHTLSVKRNDCHDAGVPSPRRLLGCYPCYTVTSSVFVIEELRVSSP
jgi:hypothetical protein